MNQSSRVVASLLAVLLVACGETRTGVFVDSRVEGLTYESDGLTGLTNAAGEFRYEVDELAAFSLGGIQLGAVTGQDVMTPITLVPGGVFGADVASTTPAILNIARLLLTLDTDGNSANGILITQTVRNLAAGVRVVFNLPLADFGNQPGLAAFLSAAAPGRALVTPQQAYDELKDSLDEINGGNGGNPNQRPVADAGESQNVTEGSQVALDGQGTDADGTIASFQWTQTAGPTVTLSSATVAAPTFTAPQVAVATDLVFELVVTDDDGASSLPDSVIVTVQNQNEPGVATFSVDDVTAAEEQSGTKTFRFTVTRAGETGTAVSVSAATADGTATEAGNDYEPVAVTLLEFAAGVEERTFDVTVNGDTTVELDETFFVNLSNASANATVTDAQGVATIENDDLGDPVAPVCPANLLCVGASKQAITPTEAHIEGIEEDRYFGTGTRIQKFNLGGFGVNPFQNFADPSGGEFNTLTENLTQPAQQPAFTGSKGIENTHVRAMSIQGGNAPVVFLMMDAIGAGNVISKNLKAAVIAEAANVGVTLLPDNILFGQTHSHAGADLQGLWGGVPQDWISNTLYANAAKAVREALLSAQPASLTVRQGSTVAFNNYRRPRVDVNADADGTLTLLEARTTGENSQAIGSLLQYNAHPTSVNEDFRIPHADYIQGAMDWLESPTSGSGGVALYYNGPIADASGSGSRANCTYPDGKYGEVRCRGEGIADAAQDFTPIALAPTLNVRHAQATLPVTNPAFVALGLTGTFNRYYDFTPVDTSAVPVVGTMLQTEVGQLTPTANTAVTRITLGGEGGLEIVTIPGEATNTFGQYIRGLKPGAKMMLLGLTQNSFGYIIPEDEFSYLEPAANCVEPSEDPFCNAGLLIPFTGYEEFVSLGPLTAPMLRLQAYNPLFDIPQTDPRNLPPTLLACVTDPTSSACQIARLAQRVDYVQRSYAQLCRNNGGPEQFCALIDPATPLNEPCRANGLPSDVCSVAGPATPGGGGEVSDTDLFQPALEALIRGCDILDTAACLMPFPSDQFTVSAAPDSPQGVNKGGTGKRINFSLAAMPRNVAGKPIDPTEWNRNDGYSPGQMIVTYVPGLKAKADGTIPGAPTLTDLSQAQSPTSSVMVLEVPQPPELMTPRQHLVWAEIDLNAGLLLPAQDTANPKPNSKRPVLIIRPAVNFNEGRRYVVVLRNLKNEAGETLPAQAPFTACRDGFESALPPVADRCAALEANVFPWLPAGVTRDESLYLAWDFTVASAENNVGRLRHMRDEAFASLGETATSLGAAPTFTVDKVTPSPQGGIAKRIEGTITVPSFVTPVEPTPGDDLSITLENLCAMSPFADNCGDFFDIFGIVDGATLPPNRLNYLPDESSADVCALDPAEATSGCALQARYGDGLPDAVGSMTTRYMCQIPNSATPGSKARPGIYGHGLLDGYQAITYDAVPGFSSEHNFMFCAVDLFGFATGDIVNVVSSLADLSNFPVIPDGSQQGMLNFMFLARLLKHPDGFAADEAFKIDGQPVFDTAEVFYDGNSQGGITGGPIVALSKDVQRGVLGVIGMNYSTLLQRSVDFDKFYDPHAPSEPSPDAAEDSADSLIPPYSLPLYLSYQDDLDRMLGFSLIQMLWDRSENNGYAHHMTRDAYGPDNQLLLQPAFGDHQVTHWSAQVMARTIGVEVADLYQRKPGEGVTHTFATRDEFFTQRDPDNDAFYALPLAGRDSGAAYDDPGCPLVGECRTAKSAFMEMDEGKTAAPPIGNVPPRADDFDPHGYPRGTQFGKCQKSHFLHTQGRIIDVRGARNVTNAATCPALPGDVIVPPVDTDLDGVPDATDNCPIVANADQLNTDGAADGGNACDADDDNDTVLDGADNCPTQSGPASNNGCPLPDADGDGVPDANDTCPNTPAGTEVDANGCPVEQATGFPIRFGEVLCDPTPADLGCADQIPGVNELQDVLDTAWNTVMGSEEPPPPNNNASCATGQNTAGNRSYQVTIPSADEAQTVSFQVLEPKTFDCANRATGAHPLILQGHGFGGSRSTSGFTTYRDAGYAVISIDQRGFGQSGGTVRVMDPDFEGKDLVKILDWAETNLDYLAYRDEGNVLKPFVARPTSGASTTSANLVAGAIGGSYGGGYQFLLHNVDAKNRLDALAPDITWHDLRYSLNPGDVVKSAWDLLLTAGGVAGSYAPGLQGGETPDNRGLDPYIMETLARGAATNEFPAEALEWFRYHSPTYWCGLNGEPTMPYGSRDTLADANFMLGGLAGDVPGSNTSTGQPAVDVLLSQGFKDTLFNFNDAWYNYQCARVRGGDVRLITHQSGHLLSGYIPQGAPAQLNPQTPGGNGNCGNGSSSAKVDRGVATVQWFNEKLRATPAAALDATDSNTLCLSLAENDAVLVPEEDMLAPRAPQFDDIDGDGNAAYYSVNGVGASSVPNGVLAQNLNAAGQATPAVVPLLTVADANGLIVAGIPQATITVSTPQMVNDLACGVGTIPTLRTGCDSIVFVGLGKKASDAATWTLIDDQIMPVRGLGEHSVDLVGVAERLANGDQLALLVYGYHTQYLASYSRDPSIPVVNVAADLQLPLYAVDAANGPAVFNRAPGVIPVVASSACTNPDNRSVTPECFATGNATNVVRQLCDYQWLPGVCEQFAHGATGYTPDGYNEAQDARALSQFVGAVHEHSGYSDGDPTAIPRDYFNSAKSGHNLKDGCTVNTDTGCDTGVKLDFMFSSEHSDNEKLPITTAAVCAQLLVDGAEAMSDSFSDESPDPFIAYLSGFGPDTPATAITSFLSCNNALAGDHHYFKWAATLEQAIQATDASTVNEQVVYDGFTGVRGFEWTNDYYNHMNVYFSTNVVNVKVDGSYASMDLFWDWLREPVDQGGGADALVTFNHPGGDPSLSPFDGSAPTGAVLQATRGGSNWNDVAYVDAGIDERVVGMEVNGGDDIEWYVKALTKGWHIGPVANEDEHQREWSTSNDGKTLILTRGRSPRDYYHAFKNRRTVAIHNALVSGNPGQPAAVPTIHYWVGGEDSTVQDGTPLGSIVMASGAHTLNVQMSELPVGTRVALINRTGVQTTPVQLGVSTDGSFVATKTVTTPTSGQDWYFIVLCPALVSPDASACGSNRNVIGITAPIWFGAGAVAPPPSGDLVAVLSAAIGRFVEAISTVPDHLIAALTGQSLEELVAALDAVIGGAQQLVADVSTTLVQQVGVVAGIDLPVPGPDAAPDPGIEVQPLMAGVAKLAIQVPVGVPLGGYLRPPVGGEYIGDDPVGELTDNTPSANDGCDPTAPESCFPNAPLPDEARKVHSPYATYSPPSRGYYDSLIAKAVALYDGHDYVVMVKTDFIGMLDEVVQAVKADVKARTVSVVHPQGIDLGDGLIMSATHTHDGPGAIANHSTRYFWLAMDLYQHDAYRRIVGQLADVVVAALADMKPAKIGHGNGLESPQTGNGNGINGYRRGRLATYDDNDVQGCAYVSAADCPSGIDDANELRKRIGVLRVDDLDGKPMAVVINFADHGIAFDVENQYFSGDVLASIEREVEQSFVKPVNAPGNYQAPIAMLVQNTGGDVTPKNVEYSIRGIEILGKRMAPQVRAIADDINNFQNEPDLRAVSQRIILNRERLGYAEDEYPYPWGAAQCGNDIAAPFVDGEIPDQIPSNPSEIPGWTDAGLPTKHLYCVPATPPDAADLADNGVAENGAFVPGDTILTAAKIGDITLMVQPGEPLTEFGVRLMEMAQSEGYEPQDTFVWGYAGDHVGYILPPEKEDWAQFGGAESTTTFWGWKQGERFIDVSRDLLVALKEGEAAPADEFQINYALYKPMYDAIPATVPTPSLLPGTPVAQPGSIKRFEKTEFVFEGGDPVVDSPKVTMQHADGTPVRRANGEVMDTFYEMHIKYRVVSGRHLWTVEFEAPKDWATGDYKFVVSGKANQGTTVAYGPLPSSIFTVSSVNHLRFPSAPRSRANNTRCEVTLDYGIAYPANYRAVDAYVETNQVAPVRTGTVTLSDNRVVNAAGDGTFFVAGPCPAGLTAMIGQDGFGTEPNKTAAASTASVGPDADEDNVGDGSDICANTPAGQTPNAAGCSASQRDTDSDGKNDAVDNCPTVSNANQADADEDGIGDACEGEPAGFPVRIGGQCDPFTNDYCASQIDDESGFPIIASIQDVLDTAWNTVMGEGGGEPPPPPAAAGGYGSGIIGVLAELMSDLNVAIAAIVNGDPAAADAIQTAATDFADNASALPEEADPEHPGATIIGLAGEPDAVVMQATAAKRSVEPVVLTGDRLPGWSAPAAHGVPMPYPSGAGPYFASAGQACGELPNDEAPFDFIEGNDPQNPDDDFREFCDAYLKAQLDEKGPRGDQIWSDGVRNAYNGVMLHPTGWTPGQPAVAGGGVPVNEIAAYRWTEAAGFKEIAVQVDERKPYFLANANSGFSFYSGTDEELSYAWTTESWGMTKGVCSKAYDPNGWDANPATLDSNTGISGAIPDPIAGLDHDDEIVFMADDAGAMGPTSGFDTSWKAVQIVRLNDALDPATERVVYLVQKTGGSTVTEQYVNYQRDPNADQWIDRSFFSSTPGAGERDPAPDRLGTSNTGYGPNLDGTVCDGASQRNSTDRFPRDGVTVRTASYQWTATGRWMVRDIRIKDPDDSVANTDANYWTPRPDLIDRWKGRAFQQSPDSTISVVGFEDEQVNWEANSSLLGERCGNVRCIREVWGADSGTNVTKTETFYRDAVISRYHVRVHPIPPDGLYTSWDYNRDAMKNPATPGREGRYYTVLRPQGVPVDGINDDVGQADSVFGTPAFFDAADPTFNLPLAFDNWEQVSGKDNSGSMVYLFELKGATSLLTPAVVPYYRDDACLDDGTGDDPVAREWPGESYEWENGRVEKAQIAKYGAKAADCSNRQGVYGAHGIHYFATGDVDNGFVLGKPINEVDGQQWQFMVPTNLPQNVADPYANVVRTPLQAVVIPVTPPSDPLGPLSALIAMLQDLPNNLPGGGGGGEPPQELPNDYATCVAAAQQGGAEDHEAAAKFACAVVFGGGRSEGPGPNGEHRPEDEIQGPNTYVEMADGTLIATNVYIPWGCNVAKNPAARTCPSILEMSGYESGSEESQTPAGDMDDILREETGQSGLPLTGGTRAAHDRYYKSGDRYVSVVASVRGTGCSAGEFDLFSRKSAEDGKYLIDEWMAQQPWSNGKVGVFGHSYSGITGAMIASTNPEHLEMVSISGQIGDIYRDIVYPGGVSNYGFPLLWTGGIRPAYDYLGGSLAGILADSPDRQCAQNQAARSRSADDPLIYGLSDTDGPWYQERSVVNYLNQVTAPTQIVTAYQDEQTGPRGGTHVFDKLPQTLTRRLVTLNGDHGSQTGPTEVTAERRFWMDRFMLDPNETDSRRKPRQWGSKDENPPEPAEVLALPAPVFADNGSATSRVLLEVNNQNGTKSNGHIDSSGFPLAQTEWTDFYFHPDGSLDTAKDTVVHGEEGSGSTYFSGSKRQAYSYQAGKNEGGEITAQDANGADELIFRMPVASDLVFAGPVTADLYITSTAPDTELMVQLIDADPATGERLYLQRGVLKATHHEIIASKSQCTPQNSGARKVPDSTCTDADNIYRPYRPHTPAPTDVITPGTVTRYQLEIFPVGHVLRAGHQLLVKVHAPSLDDNDWAYIQKTPPAINTLHHSAEYPSSIRLPVIPLAAVSRLGAPTGTCTDNQMRCVIVSEPGTGGGGVPAQDPSENYRSQCHEFGDDNDPTGGVLTDLVCGTFDTLFAAIPFDDGSGGGEPGPLTQLAAAIGGVLNQFADAYQGIVGGDSGGGEPPAARNAPDYADVCDAYGESGLSPLCGLLRTAEQELGAQCLDNNMPGSLCTLSGGNLHAVADTCYEQSGGDAAERRDGQQLAACRAVDALMLGAAAYCRQVSAASQGAQAPQFCALMGGQHVGEYEMQAFESSWIHKALRLQNRLGYDLPLIHTSLVATHNSFNATDDNTPPTLSGSDSNQLYDMVDQLRMGVRVLEIDVHWMPRRSLDGTTLREPVVCHGSEIVLPHAGCTSEKPLRAVLAELRTWLNANPNEAVLLYIESNLAHTGDDFDANFSGESYQSAGVVFNDVLGDITWKPSATPGAGSCQTSAGDYNTTGSWLKVKRSQILDAGKQVLMFADDCSGSTDSVWNAVMHKKTNGSNVEQSGSHVGASYPNTCVYSPTTYSSKFTRVWEDSTLLTASDVADFPSVDATDKDGPITPAIARELMRCGMHMPGLDQLAPSDGRLEAMVWSWAPNEPSSDTAKNCAYQNAAGRLVAAACSGTRAYACVSDVDPNDWTIENSGTGENATCSSSRHFSVPANGYANEKLKEKKATASVSEVWVNYQRDGASFEGWKSDHSSLGAGTPRDGTGDDFTASLVFNGQSVPDQSAGAPALQLTEGESLKATATIRMKDASGSYGLAANRAITLVLEVDCGGQSPPVINCNDSTSNHVARGVGVTGNEGAVSLEIPWEDNGLGRGLKSLFLDSSPTAVVHVFLVDNGASLVDLSDNETMHYSMPAQALFSAGRYAESDARDNGDWQPVVLTKSGGEGGGGDPLAPITGLIAMIEGLAGGEALDPFRAVREVADAAGVGDVLRGEDDAAVTCTPDPVSGYVPRHCGVPFVIPGSDEIDQTSMGGRTYYVNLPMEEFDGEVTTFSVYEPRNFSENGPHPLVLNGHGFGSTRTRFASGFYPDCVAGECGTKYGLDSGAGGLGGDMSNFVEAGFWVIAMDESGTGESEGVVRFMDPDYEIKKIEKIVDWAEQNLKLLAYRDNGGDCSPANATERKTSVIDGCNLVLGTTGPSYGGGYQYLLAAYDHLQRVDAIVPQITWHDLSYSLFPHDVIKSSYAAGLLAASLPSTQGRLDPWVRDEIVKTVQAGRPTPQLKKFFAYHGLGYACGDHADFSQDDTEGATYNGVPYQAPPGRDIDGNGTPDRPLRAKVDALIWHGQHDAIFAFNEDFDNYACLRRHEDADVRLYSYQVGHVFPVGSGLVTSTAFSFGGGFPTCSGPDCGTLIIGAPGMAQQYFYQYSQQSGSYSGAASANALTGCGPYGVEEMELSFLRAKLQKHQPSIDSLATKPGICLALDSSGDAVSLDHIPQDDINGRTNDPKLNPPMTERPFATVGVTLNTVQAVPVPFHLMTVSSDTVLAGIPEITINIDGDLTPRDTAEMLAETGSMFGVDDPIIYLSLARSRMNAPYYYQPYCDEYADMGSAFICGPAADVDTALSLPSHLEVIDDQVTPVRGYGQHTIQLNGIAERLAAGEQIDLLIYGYHPQYAASPSRNPAALSLRVMGTVRLPLLGNLPKVTVEDTGGGGEGYIGDPDTIGINPDTQCGGAFGFDGCISDISSP
ncbi:MAG: neutral/alkaline non-lysosomal ceramidase N-terminal domain-containing protein [Pseudomonadota bacterium]